MDSRRVAKTLFLTRSNGCKYEERLAVLVDVKENSKVREVRWKTPECQQRVNRLVKDFTDSDGREWHYDKVDDEDRLSTSIVKSVESDTSMYESIERAIEVSDWVGSAKADLEVWERARQVFLVNEVLK